MSQLGFRGLLHLCIYCQYATYTEILSRYFCLTPFVCEYNNWWQFKWDLLGTVADPLEAQEAESGVKKREASGSQ